MFVSSLAFSNREVSGPFVLKINQPFEKAFCAFLSEDFFTFLSEDYFTILSVDLSSNLFEQIFVWTDILLFQLASSSVRFGRLAQMWFRLN